MKACLYILICICLASCSGSGTGDYPRYRGFSKEVELKAEVVTLDTVLFRYPFRVAVGDGIAIVLDLHNMDHYLHAFTFPGWAHIASFGRRGNGPEELLSAETFRFVSSDSLWVLDANKMQVTRWEIDASRKSAARMEEINLDKQLIRALDFYKTGTGFIVPDYTGDNRYNVLDMARRTIRREGRIPTEQKPGGPRMALAQAWRSFMDYHPASNTLVLATQLGEVLELVDINTRESRVLYGPGGEPRFQISGGESIPTGIMGFSDVQITDRYIYAVFHGRTFKEIERNARAGKKNEDGGRLIYVFDHTGNPVIKYKLDRPIYGIHINEQSGTIIATDVNSDEPIVRFQIN